jgi:hypothetical protein
VPSYSGAQLEFDLSLDPPPETATSWPFPKPPRTEGPRRRRGGALYVWLYRRYEEILRTQAEPGFAWRDVAYRAGCDICSPKLFQPPTPAQTFAMWKKVSAGIRRFGYDPNYKADAALPGVGGSRPLLPPPPPDPPNPPPASHLLALARRRGDTRRSPILEWMLDSHAEVQQARADGRLSWTALADILAEAGLKDRDGNRPKASTVSQAWYRAETLAKRGQVKPVARLFNPAPTAVFNPAFPPKPEAAAMRPPPPPMVEDESGEPAARPKFKLSRLK